MTPTKQIKVYLRYNSCLQIYCFYNKRLFFECKIHLRIFISHFLNYVRPPISQWTTLVNYRSKIFLWKQMMPFKTIRTFYRESISLEKSEYTWVNAHFLRITKGRWFHSLLWIIYSTWTKNWIALHKCNNKEPFDNDYNKTKLTLPTSGRCYTWNNIVILL